MLVKHKSRGFEITINTRNIQTHDFSMAYHVLQYQGIKITGRRGRQTGKPSVYESANDPIRSVYSRLSDGILQVGEKSAGISAGT